MPRNAVEGATYRDHTFGMDFNIVSVDAPDVEGIPDDSEITVEMVYEDGSPTTVTLESFRKSSGIEMVDAPGR